MSLFVSSISQILQPGVFAVEVAPPLVVEGVANGYIGYVFQAPWGPVNSAFLPASQGDLIQTYWPAGSPHSGTGYLGVVRRKRFAAIMVRILGGSQGIEPPVISAVTVLNSPGSTTVSYRVTAVNGAGETIGSQTFTITNSNATLDNRIDWATVPGATSYNVYRTAGGSTQGKIATGVVVLTFTDNATSASGAIPTTNTTGWTQAVCYLTDSSGVAVAYIYALYAGTLPNSALTAQVAAASDGNANHFDLILTLQNATTGSSSERFPNLDTRTSTQILPNVTTSRLIAAFTAIGTVTTRPQNGTYSFAGGSDGSAVAASDYNTGFTQLGLRADIAVVCTDDCGDSIRTAVNADLQAHVDSKTDRIGILQGPPGDTAAQLVTDVASYTDDRIIYMGAWVTVLDDTGVAQTSPFSTFAATAIVGLGPQESHAWWDDKVTDFYTGVNSILAPQFSTADDGIQQQFTAAGICVPIRLTSGRYAALHDRTTSQTLQKRFMVTRRIKDYLVKSIKQALTPWVNGPNLPSNWKVIKIGLDKFFDLEVSRGRLIAVDPVDIVSQNNTTTQVAGQFLFVVNGKSPSVMEDIIPLVNVGPGVVGVTFQ